MTYWETIQRKIWRMWKAKFSLTRMAREVSRMTMWSGYYSLCYVVDFLHNKKGIGFSRKTLRYAFNQFLDDVEGEEWGAWKWILHLGGFTPRKGKAKKKVKGKRENPPIMVPQSPKIAYVGISPGERYNLSGKVEKVQEGGN